MRPSAPIALIAALAGLVVIPTLSMTSCAAQPKPMPTLSGARPAAVPPALRAVLGDTMNRHAEDMTSLFWATVLRDYAAAKQVAQMLAATPSIAPGAREDAHNLASGLGARFFRLQDRLRDQARDIAKAAEAKNDQQLAQGIGKLTHTCVACHATYMRPEIDQVWPTWPDDPHMGEPALESPALGEPAP